MKNVKSVSVIIPAHNEAKAIKAVVFGVLKVMGEGCEVIVVDDGSTDATVEEAKHGGARVVSHPYRIGNGAAIKTGIRNASGEVIVFMDADGQHDSKDIPILLSHIDKYDMVVGARSSKSEAVWHRRVANALYNIMATYIASQKIYDLTSGFRAIRANVLKKFSYLLPNGFSYPTTITLSLMKTGHAVHYMPIHAAKRIGKSKINIISDGVRFVMIIFKIATLFSPLKIFLPISGMLMATGIGYYFYTFYIYHRFTNMSHLLILSSLMIFLLGLVSEQIAQLRYDRSEH